MRGRDGSCAVTCCPQTHVWGSQRLVPSGKLTATLTASSSNFSTHEAIGMARSQSPACGAVTALHLALSDALGNESTISPMTRSRSGLSYMRCLTLCGNSDGSAFVAAIHWNANTDGIIMYITLILNF